jgi:MoaA/NifB/PqqE/SkfB family radical SAM enzyme
MKKREEEAAQRLATFSFLEETLEDSRNVNRILGVSLDKVGASWTKRRHAQPTDEDALKIIKKIRHVISVTQHNLR